MTPALLQRILPVALLLVLSATPRPAPAADATAEAEEPGIRLEVIELKRDSGGTLTLRMVMINENSKPFGEACDFRADDLPCANIGGIHLIDAGNKKKYPVVRDDQRKCLCSGFNSLPANGKLNLWAKFPAPPDNVEKITVVMPKFMPMDDVPIRK